jgi:hypothetical protein
MSRVVGDAGAGGVAMGGYPGHISGNNPRVIMGNIAQKRAVRNYRARLVQRGFARVEVMAREKDRDLIQTIARRLAADGPEAEKLRAVVEIAVAGQPCEPGGILAALRRSPLVGADLDLSRPREEGREIDL